MSGQYAADVTLASSDDIIVKSTDGTSDPMLKRNGDYVLGLVADNYVRVYHACDGGSEDRHEHRDGRSGDPVRGHTRSSSTTTTAATRRAS